MEKWYESTKEAGANLVETFIDEDEPDDEGLEGSKNLGEALVGEC